MSQYFTTQLPLYASALNINNGIPQLDGTGKIPLSLLPASVQSGLTFAGTWDATTAEPTATQVGQYYIVSVAGTTNLSGYNDWYVGDWAVVQSLGPVVWQYINNSNFVQSVASKTGVVTLDTGDITDFPVASAATILASASVANDRLVDATITSTKIASGTIVAANIASGTITATQIADATIVGSKIAAATIAAANIVGSTITTTQIASATITGGNIASGTITAANIQAATITTTQIASATVTGGNIAATTITAANIANATITGAKIAAATVDASNLVIRARLNRLNPSYPGAVATGDSGTLTMSNDSNGNFYRWVGSTASLTDSVIFVRYTIPNDFVAWHASKPLTVTFITSSAVTADNALKIEVFDTSNTLVGTTPTITNLASSTISSLQINWSGSPNSSATFDFFFKFTLRSKSTGFVQLYDFVLQYTTQ